MRAMRALTISTVVLLAAAGAFSAEEGEKEVVFLDPAEAGPDFAVQGEYVGKIGNNTDVGAQVIALGDGNFDAVLFAGGLPGAGWDGKTKVRLTGATEGEETRLTGKNFRGTIKDRAFTGTAEENVRYELQKVNRVPPTLGDEPPGDARVLFDGTNLEHWREGRIEDGDLLGVGSRTKQKFGDCTLHLEFRTPFMPKSRGQARGNSGMYLCDQYECQILDSFGLEGEDNECGGIYKIAKPAVNMCFPPLSWQTYDVDLTVARFNEAGEKTSDAVVTIRHNGVLIHDNLALTGPTPGGHQDDERPGPLFLQDHGDPVRFRNVWIVEK